MNDVILIIIILLVTTFSGSFGALSLKQGMNQLSQITFIKAISSKWILLGCFLYIVSAISNILLLKHLQYSVAFPMTSLTYVWTVIISHFTFKEKISPLKIISIALIIAGVVIISQ